MGHYPVERSNAAGCPVTRRALWLSLVGVLLACQAGTAQTPEPITAVPSVPVARRLNVRPHEMATATRTEQAGQQEVEVREGVSARVYVPPKCVGARRCPLVVNIGYPGSYVWADRYGMIFMGIDLGEFYALIDGHASWDPAVPYLLRETRAGVSEQATQDLDTALTRILRTFAIDPDKIGIFGNSYLGTLAKAIGSINPDVFSRIAPRATGGHRFDASMPAPKTTQFYFTDGIGDGAEFHNAITEALRKRRDGYTATVMLTPEPHVPDANVEIPRVLRWMHESWAAPDSAARTSRPSRVPPVPQLTADAVTRWTTFWSRFMQEPVAIRDTAREAHITEVPILVGREPVMLLLMDLPALAAQSPAVAADLAAAGLSAQQAQASRIALISAWLTLKAQRHDIMMGLKGDRRIGDVSPESVLGQNAAFLQARRELLDTIEGASWTTTP